MATLFPFPSSKVRVKAFSSANWAEVPGNKSLDSKVSKLETVGYLSLLFQSKTKLLPSMYQVSSGLVRGSFGNPSQGFVQWSKVSRQEWKGRDFSGLGMRVAGLRTSKKEIVLDFPSALLDIWESFNQNIHKCPLPFRSCFTWWLVKIISLLSRESFKASSIRTAVSARFQRQGKISSQ